MHGARTDRWKWTHYPTGDRTPNRHLADLYDIKLDPEQRTASLPTRTAPPIQAAPQRKEAGLVR